MVSQPDPPQRIARLTPLADVLARIDALVKPVTPREMAVSAALGHKVARDFILTPRPRTAIALRDGWAVSSDLTTDASSYAPAPLPAATRIDAGEPIPAGTDAVAPLDLVVLRDGRAEVVGPVTCGEGVLPKGADADRRVPVLQEGQSLGRARAAVLAAAGVQRLFVCVPHVRVVCVGAEADAVINAAGSFVAGDIGATGGAAILPDGTGLDDALMDASADAVVAIGGTGSGRNDASVVTLARVGRLEVHGIALAPGETAAFGVVGPRPVLLLPGRLDAALAVWLVIGRRLMARLCGSTEEEHATKAKLARKVASTLGLAEMVPVRLRDGAAEPIASGYVPLSALAQADGWILVPADSEGYPSGAEVMIRPL
jgi:molybdopterin molybdotransferase